MKCFVINNNFSNKMDVDGSNIPGEIDQNLLLQFSCMNTSDRDELINQMQRLLGPNLNYYTASFFLDMSNWNLQAAICSYLDYSVPKLPSMAIKAGPSQVPTVTPGSCFEQSWTLENSGPEHWPSSCRLIQAGGESLGASPFYVPPLPPGHSTTVTMKLVAPTTPDTHTSYFHLVTDKGEQFGETLWVTVTVECEMTLALVEQLAALPVPSGRMEDTPSNPTQDDKMC